MSSSWYWLKNCILQGVPEELRPDLVTIAAGQVQGLALFVESTATRSFVTLNAAGTYQGVKVSLASTGDNLTTASITGATKGL